MTTDGEKKVFVIEVSRAQLEILIAALDQVRVSGTVSEVRSILNEITIVQHRLQKAEPKDDEEMPF